MCVYKTYIKDELKSLNWIQVLEMETVLDIFDVFYCLAFTLEHSCHATVCYLSLYSDCCSAYILPHTSLYVNSNYVS